jgi:hypothetical protein
MPFAFSLFDILFLLLFFKPGGGEVVAAVVEYPASHQ